MGVDAFTSLTVFLKKERMKSGLSDVECNQQVRQM